MSDHEWHDKLRFYHTTKINDKIIYSYNIKGRYLKNGVSKSIVHIIKHAKFQLYRVHSDGVI